LKSEEFKQYVPRQRENIHLKGAYYYSATNGAAEQLVEYFKKLQKKFALSSREALKEFQMQCSRKTLSYGFSP